MKSTRVLTVGIHILDVLGRPIDAIPPTQSSVPVEEIRLTAAGTAAGTAVDLAGLGLDVVTVGALGDDAAGAMVRTLMESHGVDTSHLVTVPQPTSCTILPIHSDGRRKAWHVRGANAVFGLEHVPSALIESAGVFHLGGVTALPGLDGPDCVELLRRASDAGCVVTADCLGVKRDDSRELLAGYLPHVDVFVPNDEEAMAMTGESTVAGAAATFHSMGATTVIVTCGSEGAVIVDGEGTRRIPAYAAADVVDSTGCGDAFVAGVIAALVAGEHIDDAAAWGTAAASLTIEGLGSDAGKLSPERLQDRLASYRRQLAAAPGGSGLG